MGASAPIVIWAAVQRLTIRSVRGLTKTDASGAFRLCLCNPHRERSICQHQRAGVADDIRLELADSNLNGLATVVAVPEPQSWLLWALRLACLTPFAGRRQQS
jgi:hypothetical protein